VCINHHSLDFQGLWLDSHALILQIKIENLIHAELGTMPAEFAPGLLAIHLRQEALGSLIFFRVATLVNRPAIDVDSAPPNAAAFEYTSGTRTAWHILTLHLVFLDHAIKIEAINPDIAAESNDGQLLALDHLANCGLCPPQVLAGLSRRQQPA
jgi:hypothetical protein